MTPMAASFYADNRRVRNDRIKRELGVQLRYPTYREGLAALAQQLSEGEVNPWLFRKMLTGNNAPAAVFRSNMSARHKTEMPDE